MIGLELFKDISMSAESFNLATIFVLSEGILLRYSLFANSEYHLFLFIVWNMLLVISSFY